MLPPHLPSGVAGTARNGTFSFCRRSTINKVILQPGGVLKLATIMAIGGGLLFVVTSIVGLRLLILAKRHRTTPELFLGLAFVVGGTLGGPVGQIVQTQGHHMEPATLGKFYLLYWALSAIGLTAYNIFTWKVFRPQSSWAAGFVGFITGSFVLSLAWSFSNGAVNTGMTPPAQRLVDTLLYAIGPGWATAEALLYYWKLRKRSYLGLAEPVIVNRILLWGLGSAMATLIVSGGFVLAFVESTHPLAQAQGLNIGLSGVLASLIYFLAFFPPKAYTDWIEQRGDAALVEA